MAVITITEILGGDNIAGSRVTINDNFKRVTNAINTIETRLDTSFNPGGSLNVGNALIKKYTNPTSAQIFTCEATGLFQGNLNVLLDMGITQSLDVGLDFDSHKNVTFDGAAVGGPWQFVSNIRTVVTNEVANSQAYAANVVAPLLDPQTLTGVGTARSVASVIGFSVLRINAATYTGLGTFNCDTIILPAVGTTAVTNGQILTIIIDGLASATAMVGGFKIDPSTLAPGYASPIAIGAATIATNTTAIRKLAVTLFADSVGWRVLSITQPSAGIITY
jgi:hypothetical protein